MVGSKRTKRVVGSLIRAKRVSFDREQGFAHVSLILTRSSSQSAAARFLFILLPSLPFYSRFWCSVSFDITVKIIQHYQWHYNATITGACANALCLLCYNWIVCGSVNAMWICSYEPHSVLSFLISLFKFVSASQGLQTLSGWPLANEASCEANLFW